MIGHYTTWAPIMKYPASRIRTGDIAVAAQFAEAASLYYSRALYQSELRRDTALIMYGRLVIKDVDSKRTFVPGTAIALYI